MVKVTFRDDTRGARPDPGPGDFPHGAAITLADLDLDPHPWLARLRASEPVAWLPALHGWLVTRHDLAVAVMRDSATFTVDDPSTVAGSAPPRPASRARRWQGMPGGIRSAQRGPRRSDR